MRTVARETIFKIIFSSQFCGGIDETFKRSMYRIHKLDGDDIEYCDNVLQIIEQHSAHFSELLDAHSYSFPEKRIFPADRSIMLIALAEILYINDIPYKVSLNEAANIASKYSSEKSASFISGVLASISGGENVQVD